MKILAKVKDEWLQILCENAWKKYKEIVNIEVNQDLKYIFKVRKVKGGVVLNSDDIIKNVLKYDDSIIVDIQYESQNNGILQSNGVLHKNNNAAEQLLEKHSSNKTFVFLDGSSLTTKTLYELGQGHCKIKLSNEAAKNIKNSRRVVENILDQKAVVYGITTGVGKFSNVSITQDKLEELQYNIIVSHATGVGNSLSLSRTRMLLALRINALAKGYSGISLDTLQSVINAFNASCLSWVPEKGSVGASGDLAPLSHLALGLLGEGKMWSPFTNWGNARDVLKANGLQPLKLKAKEGVALINGTQLITSLGAEAIERSKNIARQADVVAALSLEALRGTTKAFDADVHKVRPHKGQMAVAKRMRSLLNSRVYPSEISDSHKYCNRVQDAYSLRCCPQVHGIVHDTIDFVENIITTEMNSATDNPIVFSERGEIISAGNFHGEYPAKALDYLSIAVHELASISERRIDRLMNPVLSGLPTFLIKEGGLNSGLMLVHCTAAALVSENKVLCHPASVDSISTNAGQEDHVSMGTHAARKALEVIENVENVIAIELLAACQAIEFLRPLKTTKPLEEVYNTVRTVVKPLNEDRYLVPDIEAIKELLQENKIWKAVEDHVTHYNETETLAIV